MRRTFRPKVTRGSRGRGRLTPDSEAELEALVSESEAELLAAARENLKERLRFVAEEGVNLRPDLGEQEVVFEVTSERPFFAVTTRPVGEE